MVHRFALALVLLSSCSSTTPPPGRSLTLLYTNDEHSHLFAFGPESDDYPTATTAGGGSLKGGVARRKVLLDAERSKAKALGDVLTVSGGDNAMGTLAQVGFPSGSDFSIMKALGYDIGCLGNHEFDFGPQALAKSITGAMASGGAPQLLSTNIHFDANSPADDDLEALYGEGTSTKPLKRYQVITTPSGLKVGFFGIMGAEAAYYAPFKVPVRFSGNLNEETKYEAVLSKLYADVAPTVEALRNQEKVDLVVALSHSGLDLAHPENGEDYLIAQRVSGIDVIVSAHSHTVVEKPLLVQNAATGKKVIVVQAGSFGQYLGRLVLRVALDGTLTYDADSSQLVPVDDKTVPDPTLGKALESVVAGLETTKPQGGKSFLEDALSHTLGSTISDDPKLFGDLYFYKLGKTNFSVVGLKPFVETSLLDLAADAEFAAGKAALPQDQPPDLAVHAAGSIRANIDPGKTGALSFGDAFRAFPLGASPYDGTVGYPLVHAYLWLIELRGALEIGATIGISTANDLFLGYSGLRVTVDTSTERMPFSPADYMNPMRGRVTKIEWNSKRDNTETYDTVLFEIKDGKVKYIDDNPTKLLHVVTNLYIASFADSQGVTLKDKNSQSVKLQDTVLHRGDTSEIKDYQAFAGYLKQLCDGNSGLLPSRYDVASDGKLPKRFLCSGPACVQP